MGTIYSAITPYIDCICEEKIDQVGMAYGRTPYVIHCKYCKLDLHKIAPSGIGYHLGQDHAIEMFRDYCDAYYVVKAQYENQGHMYVKPTDSQIREQMYRTLKDWGCHPK